MSETSLDPKTTAVIWIDLQHGIVSRKTAPHTAQQVVANAAQLSTALRAKGATIIYVRVDLANILKLSADKYMRDPNAPPPPPEASELMPEAGLQPGDLIVTKKQWGAFFGTDLEAQLRQRNLTTIILGGIATNFGVESTARAAAGLGFDLIIVEDATSALNDEHHRFAFDNIFPLIGRVRTTAQIIALL